MNLCDYQTMLGLTDQFSKMFDAIVTHSYYAI